MLRKLTKFSAWASYLSLLGLYAFSLWALFEHRADETFWSWQETWQILTQSSVQATASATLSLLFGLLLARSFFYLQFRGKALLYKLISFAWALPALVVIFALIGVWGNSGWFSQLWQAVGLSWDFSLYGLQGIVLAHLFLNIPLVAKYCLEGLQLIPSQKHQLASQLNLSAWHYFRIVELPMLKGILPYAYATVFLLCFTSFPIVLMLGGGPKYSTLEVAIYQAVTFEFDFAKAVMLIGVQILVGIGLQLLMDWVSRLNFQQTKGKAVSIELWTPMPKGVQKWLLQAVLFGAIFIILIPIANLIWTALSVSQLGERLASPLLWQAVGYSLLLSVIASLFVIALAYLIALETRQLAYRQQKIKQSILAGLSTYPLILPIFMLAVGLFLLLMNVELKTWQLMLLVGVCNGLVLLPYVYRLLFSAMWEALISHDKLARSLGLTGLRRWWIVEKNYLIRLLVNAFALSMSASLGNFSVIAFFGNPDFSTLPYLLYQQLGSYRTEDASVTALMLMLLTFLPFLWIEQKENRR
ncbi:MULTISPECIES: thiamine/thiamine pyrophosphate ABC transporter permease ThiP [Glaesserella]|uniref:Thiamine transport system permease protein ThiP n=1 Tax=Glaesserella australis TaxID=2094024 RepID=A0A328C190_9PAST|nr:MULTISPECIES: thiamine/thiamine pyrophosphate ABC transporter permease ThiP [Glaesserella]AUI67201.1 thiamine/thiamine pyrophosphate ABC transporter permease ThiP [Glaesserella sp. 15-184]RAL19537.1 thiamine/thiamine pyrophosphate ABC transporter permease ThiP [Glaesserella australis]